MRRNASGLGFAVFLGALLLRLAWIGVHARSAGLSTLDYDDEELHWQLGRNLASHFALVSDDGRYAARMPLYPLFLAPFTWIGANGVLFARAAQALIGAGTAGLVYVFTRRALGLRPALIAALLAAVDLYAVFFSALLLTEVLFTLIGVGLAYCSWLAIRRQKRDQLEPLIGAVGVALLGPLAVLTRPSSVGWVLLTWLIVALFTQERGQRWRRLGAFALIMTLALLPWGIRNRCVVGGFAWLSANGGVTLYDAQGPQAKGDSDQSFLREFERDPAFRKLGEVERDRSLRDAAVKQMRSDPKRVLQLAWTKLLRTWSLRPNVAEHSRGPTAWASMAFMVLVLLAAIVGTARLLWFGGRAALGGRRRRLTLVLLTPVAYFTLVHCIYVGSLRYRVPVMPFVEMLAGAAWLTDATGRRPARPGGGLLRV